MPGERLDYETVRNDGGGGGDFGVTTAACSGGGSSTGTTTGGSAPTTTESAPNTSATSSPGTADVQRDPQTVVDALDAAGLALCHSPDDDGHGNLFGAYANKYYYPHHTAENIQVGNTPETSCNTTDQQNTGEIEIDQYHSGAVASNALQQTSQISSSLVGWQYGNVTIEVTQSTPPDVSQQVAQVLDHLPGVLRAYGSP